MLEFEVKDIEIRPESETQESAELDVIGDATGVQINLQLSGTFAKYVLIEKDKDSKKVMLYVKDANSKTLHTIDLEKEKELV